jgi:hypothetical protein
VLSGRLGYTADGRPDVAASGDWVLLADGARRSLGTASLTQAYATLGLTPRPAGPPPDSPVALHTAQQAAVGRALAGDQRGNEAYVRSASRVLAGLLPGGAMERQVRTLIADALAGDDTALSRLDVLERMAGAIGAPPRAAATPQEVIAARVRAWPEIKDAVKAAAQAAGTGTIRTQVTALRSQAGVRASAADPQAGAAAARALAARLSAIVDAEYAAGQAEAQVRRRAVRQALAAMTHDVRPPDEVNRLAWALLAQTEPDRISNARQQADTEAAAAAKAAARPAVLSPPAEDVQWTVEGSSSDDALKSLLLRRGSGSQRKGSRSPQRGSVLPRSDTDPPGSLIPRDEPSFHAPTRDLRVPWYVQHGAHGEMEVMGVLSDNPNVTAEQREAAARAAAEAEAAAFLVQHGDAISDALGDAGAAEVQRQLADVLAVTDPEAWVEILQLGTLVAVHGKTVSIRYRLDDPEARGPLVLPPRQARFRVGFSGQVVDRGKNRTKEFSPGQAVDAAVSLGSGALASASVLLPSFASKTVRGTSSGARSRVVGGRKQRVQQYQSFDVRISAEIHVDGRDILHGARRLTAGRRQLTVGFQAGLVGQGPDDRPGRQALASVNQDKLRHFDLVLDAAGVGRAVPEVIAALRRAGLSAEATTSVAAHVTRQLLSEQSMLNRSHGIPGRIVSTPFSVPHRLGSFSGTATVTLRPGRLGFWRPVNSTLRYDIGWLATLKRGATAASEVSARLGSELIKLRVPHVTTDGYLGLGGTVAHTHGASSETGIEHGSKTTLLWEGPLHLYAGYGTVEVTFQANLRVDAVTVNDVPVQFAVSQHEAAGFDSEVLGRPSERVTGSALVAEPSSLAAAEPHMLRDMRGPGFGVLRKLPGAGDVVEAIRGLIRDQHLDTTGIDHALEYWFGQEALESMDLSGLAHGIVRSLSGGGFRIEMAVQALPAPDQPTTSNPVAGLTINMRSISGASASDSRFAETEGSWEAGGRARIKITDHFSLDAGAAEWSGSIARGNSQSLRESAVSYVRTETKGPAEDFTKPIFYVIAVRVTRRDKSVLARRYLTDMSQEPSHRPPQPGDAGRASAAPLPYTAVVSVSHEVLPAAEHTGKPDAVTVAAFHHQPPAAEQELKFHQFPSPAVGIYPVISALPELALAVATMLARARGKIGPTESITELIDVPEQINEITSPLFLQSHLVALASAGGQIVALEPEEGLLEWINPAETAIRIRARMYDVTDINHGSDAAGARAIEVERNVANTLTTAETWTKSSAKAITLMAGPRVKVGAGDAPSPGLLNANTSSRPVDHVGIQAGGRYQLHSAQESGRQQGAIQVARAIYKQTDPSRWDAKDGPIEHTQTMLLKSGLWLDYELVSTRSLTGLASAAAVHVKADKAINMLVPVPLARVLFPRQLPSALDRPVRFETPGRIYIDPEAALKLSAVESVSAARVLPAIIRLLARHGIKDSAQNGDLRALTRPFHQKLVARFSEPALERQFPLLINGGGIVAWIPRSTGFGMSYIGIRVTAALGPANAEEVTSRPNTHLMVRTEPTDRTSGTRKHGSGWWGGFSAGAIGLFGRLLGGGSVHGGYQRGQSFESETLRDRTDFYRMTSTSGTYGFPHGLRFRIEAAGTWSAPEILRLPASGLKSMLLLPGVGERQRASFWFRNVPWSWQDTDTVDGKAIFLVLGALTRPVTEDLDGPHPKVSANSPPPDLTEARWLAPGKAAGQRETANDELATVQFVPLAFPAAHLVHGLVPWLLAPGQRGGRSIASLAGTPRPGFDLGHLRGARNAAMTSAGMLTAQVHAMLLQTGYNFTVSGNQRITAQFNLKGITYLDASVLIKDRLYSQNEVSQSARATRSHGADLQFMGEIGGYPDLLYEGWADLGLGGGTGSSLGGEGGEIHEYDVETSRNFHFVSLDIQLLLDAGQRGGLSGDVSKAIRLAIPERELDKLIGIAGRYHIPLTGFAGRRTGGTETGGGRTDDQGKDDQEGPSQAQPTASSSTPQTPTRDVTWNLGEFIPGHGRHRTGADGYGGQPGLVSGGPAAVQGDPENGIQTNTGNSAGPADALPLDLAAQLDMARVLAWQAEDAAVRAAAAGESPDVVAAAQSAAQEARAAAVRLASLGPPARW